MPSASIVLRATAGFCGVAAEGLSRLCAGITGENGTKARGTVHPARRKAAGGVLKEAGLGAGPRPGREVPESRDSSSGGAAPTH